MRLRALRNTGKERRRTKIRHKSILHPSNKIILKDCSFGFLIQDSSAKRQVSNCVQRGNLANLLSIILRRMRARLRVKRRRGRGKEWERLYAERRRRRRRRGKKEEKQVDGKKGENGEEEEDEEDEEEEEEEDGD